MKYFCTYILTNKKNGTLYTGITSNLYKRVWEHKGDFVDGFTKRYGVHTLVYFEIHDNPDEAIRREKQIKRWRRKWKIELIEQSNPEWRDLFEELDPF